MNRFATIAVAQVLLPLAALANEAGFELLGRNQLEDSFSASPAVVGGELYLRGQRSLYCIAEDRAQ